MGNMMTISIDELEVKRFCHERVAELVKEVDAEYVFWDTAELKKRTCMSWNTIQKNFFFDPRLPKRKVGGQWYFPVEETREFLKTWLLEQS